MSQMGQSKGWKLVRLDEISTVITGKTPSTKEPRYWNGSIPFITPSELQGGRVTKAARTITEEGLRKLKPLPKGTVLVSCIGYIGKVAVLDTSVATTNQQINAVVPNVKLADSWYLAYRFIFDEPRLRDLAGITTIPILNKANFEAFQVCLPPLTEQRAIARALRAVQEARDARQKELLLERERKAALMRHLFTHGTRGEARKQTEIGEIPKSWHVMLLGELCIGTPQNGAFFKNPQFGSGTLYVNVYDIYQNTIVDLERISRLECDSSSIRNFGLRKNDILFVRSSLKRAGIGQCCLIWAMTEPAIFDCHLIRVSPNSAKVVPLFLTYYFLSEGGKNDLIARSKTTTMTTMNQKGLLQSLVPIPSLDEQERIAHTLSCFDTKIAAIEKESVLLDEVFRAMLEELMTGRLSAVPLIE